MDTRTISPAELAAMRAWLDQDAPGAVELRGQLDESTEVYALCDCGCASIGFVHQGDPAESGVSIFDVDAEIVDEHGESVGGMMLTIRSGHLHDVDVHSWFDEFPFPDHRPDSMARSLSWR